MPSAIFSKRWAPLTSGAVDWARVSIQSQPATTTAKTNATRLRIGTSGAESTISARRAPSDQSSSQGRPTGTATALRATANDYQDALCRCLVLWSARYQVIWQPAASSHLGVSVA